MSGWGGVVLSGLAGAAEGVGKAGYEDILQKEKDAAQLKMQQQLATLQQQTHAVNAQGDIDRANANAPTKAANDAAAFEALTPATVARNKMEKQDQSDIEESKPKVVPREARLVNPTTGEIIVEGEEKKLTPEEKALNDARIAELKASAAAHYAAAARPDKEKAEKTPPKPKWVTDKDTGVVTEEATGIVKKVVDEEPAVKGSDGILGFGKKAGKAAVPARVEFFTPEGQPMTKEDFYSVFPGAMSGKQRDVSAMPSKPSVATQDAKVSHGLVVARRTNANGDTQVKYEDGFVENQ